MYSICSCRRHFCIKIQKILAQSLLLTLAKQFPAESKQINIQKNVRMPMRHCVSHNANEELPHWHYEMSQCQ